MPTHIVVLAVAFAFAIALVAYRLGRSRTSRPAGVRVTMKEVMDADALLRRYGGLDAEDAGDRRPAPRPVRPAAGSAAGGGIHEGT